MGYARVSTEAQNLDRQLDALKEYGADIIYNEKMTGTRKDRPELAKLIDRMTEGIPVASWQKYKRPDRADRIIPKERGASGFLKRKY